jgi:hypothetical protein
MTTPVHAPGPMDSGWHGVSRRPRQLEPTPHRARLVRSTLTLACLQAAYRALICLTAPQLRSRGPHVPQAAGGRLSTASRRLAASSSAGLEGHHPAQQAQHSTSHCRTSYPLGPQPHTSSRAARQFAARPSPTRVGCRTAPAASTQPPSLHAATALQAHPAASRSRHTLSPALVLRLPCGAGAALRDAVAARGAVLQRQRRERPKRLHLRKHARCTGPSHQLGAFMPHVAVHRHCRWPLGAKRIRIASSVRPRGALAACALGCRRKAGEPASAPYGSCRGAVGCRWPQAMWVRDGAARREGGATAGRGGTAGPLQPPSAFAGDGTWGVHWEVSRASHRLAVLVSVLREVQLHERGRERGREGASGGWRRGRVRGSNGGGPLRSS